MRYDDSFTLFALSEPPESLFGKAGSKYRFVVCWPEYIMMNQVYLFSHLLAKVKKKMSSLGTAHCKQDAKIQSWYIAIKDLSKLSEMSLKVETIVKTCCAI